MVELSTSFSIDPGAPWVRKHNSEAMEVLEAFEIDRPIRVPLVSANAFCQHGFYIEEVSMDMARYFTDPDVMLWVQLEAARRRRELPICDFILGEKPESWPVTVDQHPIIPYGWAGCELVFPPNNFPGSRSMNLPKHDCLAMQMPDLEEGGILVKIHWFLQYLKEKYECRITFLGRPVGPVYPFVVTYGVFDLAMAIRGQDLMVDMYEDPEFADAFILKIAGWCKRLADNWGERNGNVQNGFPFVDSPSPASDHGIDMLPPELYERFIVPAIKESNRGRTMKWGTCLHHCGRGVHLFPIIKKHFGLTHLEALTFPYVDIARVRSELGAELWIIGGVADNIVAQGPPERIRQTVKELMESGAKGKGRFCLQIGDMVPGTPIEHRIAYYEAVKEFGRY
ncbi:MAG: hypothetical protein IMZ62_03605 [Chloroflexi bacterium]|nr:hypothetical protein [Chloroflexota bacterium]